MAMDVLLEKHFLNFLFLVNTILQVHYYAIENHNRGCVYGCNA